MLAGLIWTFGLLSSAGFAQTDAELAATIGRFLEKDESSMAELTPLPPRSVVVMTKMLKDLPEGGPHAVLFTVLGLKVEQCESVLGETELRDALKVLVEKKVSANVALQDSNEAILRRIASKARIRKYLIELGALSEPARENRNWLVLAAVIVGVLSVVGILFRSIQTRAKQDGRAPGSAKSP